MKRALDDYYTNAAAHYNASLSNLESVRYPQFFPIPFADEENRNINHTSTTSQATQPPDILLEQIPCTQPTEPTPTKIAPINIEIPTNDPLQLTMRIHQLEDRVRELEHTNTQLMHHQNERLKRMSCSLLINTNYVIWANTHYGHQTIKFKHKGEEHLAFLLTKGNDKVAIPIDDGTHLNILDNISRVSQLPIPPSLCELCTSLRHKLYNDYSYWGKRKPSTKTYRKRSFTGELRAEEEIGSPPSPPSLDD